MFVAALLAACTAPEPAVPSPTCALPESVDEPAPATANDAPAAADVACGPPIALGLTYEIYVRSFQDTDADGIGDLAGVRARLDHLEGLGVETIWLMPLFPSVGPAGYDVTDFGQLREEYGDEAELAALVDDAHARGMRVLLDLPLNHVARTHPWFAAAEGASESEARDGFVFSDTQWDTERWFPASGGGYYYGFFGADLPDLDWTDPLVRVRMFDVFGRWLDVVDGYRLDAVITLVEADGAITGTDATHALLAELYAFARARNPDAVVLAEASEPEVSASAAYLGTPRAPESDRVLDFPRRDALLAALAAGRPEALLAHLHDQADAGSLGRTAPFLQSHDLSRLPAYVPDPRARRLLQVLQLTLPGDPVLYYGEELDLADATTATGQDYAWRAPMPWDASPNGGFTDAPSAWLTPDPAYARGANVADAGADPTSLLTLVRDLACVRAELVGADWEPVAADAPSVLAFQRWTDGGRLVVVANLAAAAVGDVGVDVHGGFRSLTAGAGVDAGDGLRIPSLPAYGYALYAEEIAGACGVAGPVP